MTGAQMRWAASHDWYVGAAILLDGTYIVYATGDKTFDDFDTLYSWAGY